MRPRAILQRAALAARHRVGHRIPHAVRSQVRRWLFPPDPKWTAVPGSIAAVYLAREANGLAACERFVESYRTFPAGVDHDLVVIFKGFKDPENIQQLRNLLSGLRYREYPFEDYGFDLTPYFTVGNLLNYEYFFFMNTFSRILAPQWLAKMRQHLLDPSVGLVGATASYEAMGSPALSTVENKSWRFWEQDTRAWRAHRRMFPHFPNHHIRSNAFGLSKRVLERIRVPEIREKMDAFRLESGRKEGMTRQVLRMGLKPVVVGRDGAAYLPRDWWKSNTFRQANQANLLVADNQTEMFDKAAPDHREALAQAAWGDRAQSKCF